MNIWILHSKYWPMCCYLEALLRHRCLNFIMNLLLSSWAFLPLSLLPLVASITYGIVVIFLTASFVALPYLKLQKTPTLHTKQVLLSTTEELKESKRANSLRYSYTIKQNKITNDKTQFSLSFLQTNWDFNFKTAAKLLVFYRNNCCICHFSISLNDCIDSGIPTFP